MSPASRRELSVAVLLCLTGAFAVLVAAGRAWVQVDVAATGLVPGRTVGVLGTEIAPGVRALGLVGLAGVVALAATRRAGRTAVGLLLLAVGAGVVAAVLGADSGSATAATVAAGGGSAGDVLTGTGWPAVAVVGGVLLGLAGLLVAARGRRWSALSQRFDVPGREPVDAPPEPSPEKAQRELWERLDRGEDPTGQ